MSYLVIATAICYAASLGGYIAFLKTAQRAAGLVGTALLAAGVVFHYMALVARSSRLGMVPYNDLFGSLSLFAWLLAVTYFGLELFHRQRAVGAFVMPVVLIAFAVSDAGSSLASRPAPAGGALLALHITLNMWGYAALAISSVLSLIYLIQNSLLRHRKLTSIVWRFPALEVLERMSRSGVAVGLILLVIGIAFGFIWIHRISGQYWNGDPKEVITLVILAVYAGYLWLGRTKSWRGARASALCVFNFVFVLFSYSVVNLYLSGFHRYF
jgi:ABC-type transport system involved in cytochrome c biogenesis permease subunit